MDISKKEGEIMLQNLFAKPHIHILRRLKALAEKDLQPRDLDMFVEVESQLLKTRIPDEHAEIRLAYLAAHAALFHLDIGTANLAIGGTDYKMCHIEESMNHINKQMAKAKATKVA
ncbi:hypothetical protein KKE14_03125 [Patescibacteria group bacterium]|nr:hypothetical protein [Patescibacteria group bacterium]